MTSLGDLITKSPGVLDMLVTGRVLRDARTSFTFSYASDLPELVPESQDNAIKHFVV
jgi:hypothetical protein